MGRIFTILACGLILGPISAGVAQAQIDDHLKCYKIKDDLKAKTYKGFVDLDSLQFGLEPGCKITKAKLFCVPVTKSNVQRKAKDPVDLLPIFGPPAPGDRICYKINCAGPVPPDTTASDQFGTHKLTDFKAFMLCTPATKIFPPLCDQSGYPTCAGDCPDPNQTCHPASDGTTECLCEETCGFDAAGICGGDCPDPNRVCAVVYDSVDPNRIATRCDCLPTVDPLCGDTFPQCDGPCPNPDDECVVVNTGTASNPVLTDCRCEPQPLCEDSFDACDGDCPPDEDCVVVFDSADPQNPVPIDCTCEPSTEPPCGDTFPQCDGTCPPMEKCVTGDPNNPIDCRCEPEAVCGNGVVEPGEECDPATGISLDPNIALADSPTCDIDCTGTVCGDGYANMAANETCDGADDAQCPGNCNPDCTCP